MATYVMSDIHGESDRFNKILEMIDFSEEDTLYILGDVVDRGPDGIPLLVKILGTSNIHMLLGNHEHMMMRYYSSDVTDVEIRRWDKNNNAPTKAGLAKLSPEEMRNLLERINNLPTHAEITVMGVDYYLVHGFPGDNLHDEVWSRPDKDTVNPLPQKRLIIGHTPIIELDTTDNYGIKIDSDRVEKGNICILHTKEFINIDCSCGYADIFDRALACLRLDDMAEFYA